MTSRNAAVENYRLAFKDKVIISLGLRNPFGVLSLLLLYKVHGMQTTAA